MMMMNLSLLLPVVGIAVAFLLFAPSAVEAFTTTTVAFTTTTKPTVHNTPVKFARVSSSPASSSSSSFSSSTSKLLSSSTNNSPLGDGDDEEVPFALRDTPTTTSASTSGSSSSDTGFDPSDIMGKIQGAIPQDLNLNLDMGAFGESLSALQSNLVEGPVGERGEIYAIAQVGVLLCILIGTVPVVGGLLMVLLGPGLLLAGIAVMVLSVQSMGSALSPWPTPPTSGGRLITDGLYAEVRHPMYAGLLAACTGYSIVTDSASRLLLTAVLLYALDVKTNKEEEAMRQAYPGEYDKYSSQVTNKFFPQSVLDILPW